MYTGSRTCYADTLFRHNITIEMLLLLFMYYVFPTLIIVIPRLYVYLYCDRAFRTVLNKVIEVRVCGAVITARFTAQSFCSLLEEEKRNVRKLRYTFTRQYIINRRTRTKQGRACN